MKKFQSILFLLFTSFVLYSQSLKFTMDWPSEITNFEVGSLQKITWESNGVDNVAIEYSTNAGNTWNIIESNYPAANGYYNWTIPNTPSIFCLVKIFVVSDTIITNVYPEQPEPNSPSVNHFTIYGNNKWTKIESPTTNYFTNVKFFDVNNGIIWGNNVLIVTNDGGNTWNIKSNFISKDAYFVDENNGWCVNNDDTTTFILETKDGGKTWEKQFSTNIYKIDQSITILTNIFMLDKFNGKATGYIGNHSTADKFIFLSTTDGGINWKQIEPEFSPTYSLSISNSLKKTKSEFITPHDLQFTDSLFGWISYDTYDGINFQRITNDGGNTYNYHPESEPCIPNPNLWIPSYGGHQFYAQSKTNMWQITKYDVIDYVHKYNPEQNKMVQILASWWRKFENIYFFDDNLGWIYGGITPLQENRFIIKTKDGGQNWELQQFELAQDLPEINDFFSLDGETAWAVGAGGLIMHYENSTSTPQYWKKTFLVIDNNNNSAFLNFGQAYTAANSIDKELGETELPPPPPLGTFDARFILEDNSSSLLDIRNSDNKEISWTIQFQTNNSGYPITFNWDNKNLPFGSFFLRDIITGKIINIDMKLNNSFTLSDENINKLNIVYKEEFTQTITYNKDWNLVSVPLKTQSNEVNEIFNNFNSDALTFDGSYKSTSELENGKGYWLKFNKNTISNIYGDEITEQIKVMKGWNLIGGFDNEISISNVVSNPSDIITSSIYGFNSSYFVADKLVPGKGYWLKSNSDGELNLIFNNSLSQTNSKILADNKNPFISIPIKAYDGVGDTILLNVGIDSAATKGLDKLLGEEELPPLPPSGIFDVRFSLQDSAISTYNDYRTANPGNNEHIIKYQLGDNSNGLTLSWSLPDGVSLNISDLFGGSVFYQDFGNGEASYTITNTNVNNVKLTLFYSDKIFTDVKSESIPTEYSLSQNYPNPFNPTTTIRYQIPEQIRNDKVSGLTSVRLNVFDILGREVTTLVNREQKPGFYEVNFNANNLSSGIYYYQIKAGNYVQTKKMILMK